MKIEEARSAVVLHLDVTKVGSSAATLNFDRQVKSLTRKEWDVVVKQANEAFDAVERAAKAMQR